MVIDCHAYFLLVFFLGGERVGRVDTEDDEEFMQEQGKMNVIVQEIYL